MVTRLFLFFFAAIALPLAAADDYTIIENGASLPLLNPNFSGQQIEKIRLNNGLEAYLVSDPNTPESGAALTVKVGSWDEPSDAPGLAHFLEHLLFLGTATYPDESEYSQYIADHNGVTNAFTTSGFTSYMFAVSNPGFEGALDRFSRFFYEPRFNSSGVQRELNAIDQEYAQNIQKDSVREIYVLKNLSKPEHPNKKFSMGNSASLKDLSRERLIQWYREHYSANLMKLIVVSSLPLDKLKSLVIKNFGSIPNTNRSLGSYEEFSLPSTLAGKIIYVEPIKDVQKLTLFWELPKSLSSLTDSRPDNLLCQILGHEGTESLYTQLKEEKLIESISCGAFEFGPDDLLLTIELDITAEGVARIETIIQKIFQTLAVIKQEKDLKYIFDEMKQMSTIKYQYQERKDLFSAISDHAQWLAIESMEQYPENAQILSKWDPKAFHALLNYLTIDRAFFVLLAPSSMTGVVPDEKEPWLHTEYAIKPVPREWISLWEDASPLEKNIIPPPNPYIPKNLKLTEQLPGPSFPNPYPLLENEKGTVYFAPDTLYHVPQAYFEFHIKTPSIGADDPDSMVLGQLYVSALSESLTGSTYQATIAGLNYSIDSESNGIGLLVTGYSDNISLLLAEILDQFRTLKLTEEQFERLKARLMRIYSNADKESPLKQVSELLKTIIFKRYTSHKQKLLAIRKITYAQYQEFVDHLFDETYVEGILYGNLQPADAKKIAEGVSTHFRGKPYPKQEHKNTEVIVLPDAGPYYLDETIRVHGNAALLAIESTNFSFKARAAQQILMQALGDAFFATLRTRQQTGYLVTTRGEEIERKMFNVFAVQSNSHDVRDLLARFELFIEEFLQELEFDGVPEERFENIRTGILLTMEQPPSNLAEMGSLLNRYLEHYDAEFNWLEKRIEGMRTLTYEEFVSYSREFLGRQNKRRVALLLKGELPSDKLFRYTLMESPEEIRSLSEFTSH